MVAVGIPEVQLAALDHEVLVVPFQLVDCANDKRQDREKQIQIQKALTALLENSTNR